MVLRASLSRCSQSEYLVGRMRAGYRNNVSDLGLAPGQGACFIEDYGIYLAGPLQGGGVPDQDAVLCSFACAHYHRSGRGQAQAQGQAMMITAINAVRLNDRADPDRYQARKVTRPMPSTVGTK